jgi:hypothetical protein
MLNYSFKIKSLRFHEVLIRKDFLPVEIKVN